MKAQTTNTKDCDRTHLPVDVVLVLDEGDRQIAHMDASKHDFSSALMKLSRRQYETLRNYILKR